METVDIADIHPYPNNPRINEHAIESTKRSIEAFGFLVPVVVDGNGVLIAGHTRLAAAQQLGMTELPAVRAEHLNEEQARQFRLIDNKVAELARWDFDLLGEEISTLKDSGIDFTEFGWSREEIDCLADVVADDCLSGSTVTDLEAASRQGRADRRAPSQTRFVCGEFVFFIPQAAYRRWAAQVRNENDYDEATIARSLRDVLGITPYLEE